MTTVNNQMLKFRIFRRRHRVSLIISVFISILFIFLFVNGLALSNAINTNESVVNDPHQSENILTYLIEKMAKFNIYKKKTVPFAKTDAASLSEFNNMMTTTSNQNLDKMLDETKLRLILESSKKIDPNENRLLAGHVFYQSIFKVFYEGKPKVEKLDRYLSDERIPRSRYTTGSDDEILFNEEYLSRFLQLDQEELDSMTESHKYVVDNLPDKAPGGLYSGNGIVYVGGGKFNWLTLLSIKSIRAMGSDLPIEVLIPTLDEYEPELCARVFPALNARCIYLPYALNDQKEDSYISKFTFKGYQYKALAILLLSFENVLLLDSDNVPVRHPDNLFEDESFKSNGLIVWPDFWKRTTSPNYYKIAGISLSTKKLYDRYNAEAGAYEKLDDSVKKLDVKDLPLHLREGAIPDPSSESGQLMISKKTHIRPLLLALYYNLFGPTHFYPLFSQGSPGEGDKETFIAATVALKKPFHQVAHFLNALGYMTSTGFEGTGMGQFDPVEDYLVSKKRKLLENKSEKERLALIESDPLLKNGPRILFVHANYPKLDPWELKTSGKIFDENGNRLRLYGTGVKAKLGHDFETVQWTNMKSLLCELNIQVSIYKNVDRAELCQEINDHLDFLKSTISTLE